MPNSISAQSQFLQESNKIIEERLIYTSELQPYFPFLLVFLNVVIGTGVLTFCFIVDSLTASTWAYSCIT